MFFSFEPHEKFEDLCDKVRAQWKERERGRERGRARDRERQRERQTETDRDRQRETERELQNVTAFQKEIKDSKMS